VILGEAEVARSAGLAGEGEGEPGRPGLDRRIVRLRLRLLLRNGIALRANDDETPDPREFRLEGAEG
jgi:hypothetical protein